MLYFLSIATIAMARKENLYLIENKGQITDQYFHSRSDIDYVLKNGAVDIFVGQGQIVYQFKQKQKNDDWDPAQRYDRKKRALLDMHRIDVRLLGANRFAKIICSDKQEYYERYYSSKFGSDGGLAHSFGQITYKEIYPNIDWVIKIEQDKLKYEFVVHEGGDPNVIQLEYNGATEVNINSDGSMIASGPLGNIIEKKPYCFTSSSDVASSYKLSGNVLSFNLASYSGTLTIDPTVEWMVNCCGETGYDDIGDMAVVDPTSVYISGHSHGGDVATIGAYQTTCGGSSDVFLMKLDNNGNRLWGTYFGDTGMEQTITLAYDGIGALYIGGPTTSTAGITSPGAHQETYQTNNSFEKACFLAKFSLTGNRIWSTYYGGDATFFWALVECDRSGNPYIVGTTWGGDGIATPGSHKTVMTGGTDGFIAKFNTNGIRQWSTYIGGGNIDEFRHIAFDYSGNFYVTGQTQSADNIATAGIFEPDMPSLGYAGCVAKFDTNGTRLWGTYYGDGAKGLSVACDHSDNVFVGGTVSNNASDIATPGAFQSSFGGGNSHGDDFIGKLTPDGQREWGTFIGGDKTEYLEHVVCDNDNFVYFVGYSRSTSGLTTPNAFQPNYGGGLYDGLFGKFQNNGVCTWNSYFGFNQTEVCFSVKPGFNNSLYLCGSWDTTGFDGDGFLVKFQGNNAGIQLISNKKKPLYPNPATDRIYSLSWTTGQKTIITNAIGQILYQGYITQQDLNDGIAVDKLPPGIYILYNDGNTERFTKL